MIIINTTFHVRKTLSEIFLKWIREEYALCAAKAGMVAPRLTEILVEVEPENTSYAFSVITRNIEEANKWYNSYEACCLRQEVQNKYGKNILYFTTYMKSLPL